MRQKLKILYFILFLAVANTYAQEKVDKLIDSLTIVESDESSVDLALQIAAELKYSDWERAEHYIRLAKEKSEEASPELQAKFHKKTAKIYYDRDLFDLAIQYNLKAYDFYKDVSSKEQYEIENMLAIIHSRLYNEKQAFYYLKRVYEYNKHHNNQKLTGIILNNMGGLLLDVKKPDSALHYLNRAKAVFEKLKNEKLLVTTYTNISRGYAARGNNKIAEDYLNMAIALAKKVHDNDIYHFVFYSAADYYLSVNKAGLAKDYAEKAATLEAVKYSLNNLDVLRLLYKSNLALGDYKEAASFFQEYDSIRDSLNIEEKAINVEKQRIEYEFKNKEEINRLQDKQKRLTLTVAVLALCIVLLILGMFLIKYKNRLVKEKLLNNLNQSRENELRLQIELKDKELASKAIAETRREEVYNSVLDDLKKIKQKSGREETRQALSSVLSKLESSSNKAIWEEFELRFANVYESFYKNLQRKHPDLSSYDKRICALIKLNLSTKEIADITGVTTKSVENTRTRLRKKLNLTNEKIDLNRYLSEI